MARKKSTATIESEISKTEAEMTKIQDRYNKLADKLKDLQEQKRQIESEEIMEAPGVNLIEATCPNGICVPSAAGTRIDESASGLSRSSRA